MNLLFLIPTIHKPTRIADASCTLIDNIFVSNLHNFTSVIFTVDQLLTYKNYKKNLPIFLTYKNYFLSETRNPIKITYRSGTETSLYHLSEGLHGNNLNEILAISDTAEAIELFHNKIIYNSNHSASSKLNLFLPKITKAVDNPMNFFRQTKYYDKK